MLSIDRKIRRKIGVLFKLFVPIIFAFFLLFYFYNVRKPDYAFELSRLPAVVNKEEFSKVLAQRDYWKKEIERNGPEALHELIKSRYPDDFYGHEVMHIFGELLYEVEGIEGVGVCDDTYTYGCYHAFFGRAIRDQGVGIISELMEKCRKNLGHFDPGCQHGLGHGIVQFFGYARLSEAKAECEKLSFSGNECQEGVAMEYHRVLRQIAAVAINDFKEGREFEGCYSLGDDQINECFYILPLLWSETSVTDYQQIDALCSYIAKEELYKEACYQGVGRAAALSGESDADSIIQNCMSIRDYKNQKICLREAHEIFTTEKGDEISASKICEPLKAEERLECLN